MEQENNKTKWLHLRLSPAEHTYINKQFKKTTCRKLSEYARKILLGKPIVASYRNESMDKLMSELISLRYELNAIGNNFNQAVRKLNATDRPEQMLAWVKLYERDKDTLLASMVKVEKMIAKISDLWLQ